MNPYKVISANKWKTWLIMILFIMFFATVSYILAQALGYGVGFVGIMLVISGLMSFFSYYYSDKIVLSLAGAHVVNNENYPELYNIVENLSIATGNPMPKVYVSKDPTLNAFATGRDPKHAAVCATTGLLEHLSKAELEGVMAHELSHVKNYDTRLMGVVSILVGSIAILADFFLRSLFWGGMGKDNDSNSKSSSLFLVIGLIAAIIAPIAATLIQLAISRRREFLADASGALITRYPEGLARALEKIASDPRVSPHASTATAHFYIENPFKTDTKKKNTSWFLQLFSTHPPVEERIKILRSM